MSLSFSGHQVELRKVDGEVLIHCKNVVGLYSQMKAFKEGNSFSGVYPYGVKTKEPGYIRTSFDGMINVSCLSDTREAFDKVLLECERMLGL